MSNPCEHILECKRCQDHERDCIIKEGHALQARVKDLETVHANIATKEARTAEENTRLRKVVDTAKEFMEYVKWDPPHASERDRVRKKLVEALACVAKGSE